MGSAYCMSCGAPLVPGAQFCASCGTAVPGTSQPLGSSSQPAYAPSTYSNAPTSYGGSPPPPARRRSRLLIVLVVLVVLVLVIGVIGYIFLYSPPPAVQVSEIDIWANDNACGLNTNGIAFTGFNGSTNQVQSFQFQMPNYNATNCTVRSISTNTSGFVLSQFQPAPPFVIPGSGSNPGAVTLNLNITIKSPSSDYSGSLNVDLT